MSIQFGQWNIDKATLSRILDFLPYPFLICEVRNKIAYNSFLNRKFVEEIGYTTDEINTLNEWFYIAYPDEAYRQTIIRDWTMLVENARTNNEDSVVLKAQIQTKHAGRQWYEVKSSISGDIQLVAFININDEILKEEELVRLNENKNRTLAILSHDLRGPITNLHALSLMAMNRHLTQEEFVTTVKNVQEKTFQALEFLDTALHWTKSNFDNIRLQIEQIDLAAIVTNILKIYETASNNKKLIILLENMTHPVLLSDGEIITIVFRNLLSNAIKFTPDGGHITVRIGEHEGKSLIAVEDSGIGMSREMINIIFSDRYHSQNGTRQEKGLGIGLRLCGELLKKINANITIESEVGRGTCVSIIMGNKSVPAQ